MAKIYWTNEKLQVIKSCVLKYGVSIGCSVAATKLHKSSGAIQKQYYAKIYTPNLVVPQNQSSPSSRKIKLDEKDVAKYLTKELQNHPESITTALSNTADKYDVSLSYMSARYYGTYYKQDKHTDPLYRFNLPLSVCTIGGTKALYNGKQQSQVKKEIKKTSWLLTLLSKIFKYGED